MDQKYITGTRKREAAINAEQSTAAAQGEVPMGFGGGRSPPKGRALRSSGETGEGEEGKWKTQKELSTEHTHTHKHRDTVPAWKMRQAQRGT